MKRYTIEVKWALIFILVSLLWMVLERVCGLHDKHIGLHLYLTNLFAIPAIWIYVLALKDKKKRYYKGQMNFMQGFLSGCVLTIIIAAFSPLTQWITSYVITPDYFTNVIEYSLKTGYLKTRAEAEEQFNFRTYVIQGLIGALAMGLITSAIVALFVRTRPPKTH